MIEQILKSLPATSVILFFMFTCAQAQGAGQCYGRVYNTSEVTRRAKITEGPDLNSVNTVAQGQRAHVVIRAVLCRTGSVTDLQLLEGTPSDLTEDLKRAVTNIRFTPAEFNWHSVSQRMAFEFDINDGETKVISDSGAKGREVERLEILGIRRLTAERIMSWIRTKPGEMYDGELVANDLKVILSKGYFDQLETRVLTEKAVRGGIAVVFVLAELPVIAEVRINGLTQGYSLLASSKLALVGIDRDEPFDVAKVKLGISAIRQFLESKGWRDVRVESTNESVNADTVIVTFNVSGHRPQ
jgi:hypothetical protein